MTDVVYNVSSHQAFIGLAQQLGFYDSENVQTVGNIPTGGSYFLNHVGEIADQTGEWGRLRLNGETNFLATLPQTDTLTIYFYSNDLGGWTHDNVNLAPDFVGSVGAIA